MIGTVTRSIDTPLLAVAWRTAQRSHGRKLNTGGDLQQYLQQIVDQTDSIVDGSTIEAYRPDGGEPEPGILFSTEISDRIDTALIEELNRGEDLDFAERNELRKHRLSCYALITGMEGNQRLYLRRQNPVRLAGKRLYSSLMNGPLTEVQDPVLSFDDRIDVVVEPGRVIVLDVRSFESLFRDSETVLEAVPKWIDEFQSHVKISEEGREVLLTSVRRNSIHRRKLLAILESPYANTLTPERIRNRMEHHGLDHSALLVEETLQVTEGSLSDILKLLNEDLYRGDFSDEHFAASGKRVFRV